MLDTSYYIVAALVALLAAALNYLYARTLPDSDAPSKVFFKTLLAGLIAGVAVTWGVGWLGLGGAAGAVGLAPPAGDFDAPPLEPFIAAPAAAAAVAAMP